MGIPTEFQSFGGRRIPLTLMEATFDYPYLKDESNGFEIISLPYEHDGKIKAKRGLSMGLILFHYFQ